MAETLTPGDTTANIAGGVTTAGAEANSLLLILDTTKGHAVLVHDADWNTAGGRNVVNILSLTTQAAIDALANGTILTQ